MDIVAIDERTGVALYLGQRDGRFSSAIPLAGSTPAPYARAVGDLNRDGRIDVVLGHVGAPSTVYFNDGSGRRSTAVNFGDSKGTAYDFAIGDLNEDGVLDIGVARSKAPNIVFFGARPK